MKDLLCGEALSPITNYCSAHRGMLHHDDCNAAPRWRAKVRPGFQNPCHDPMGSSLPAEVEQISPCSKIHCTILLPTSCADEITTTSSGTARSRDCINPTLRLCYEPARVVTDSAISTLVELGEAMRVLQQREAQTSYRLSDRYIDALLGFGMPAGSYFVKVCNVRRDGVFLIFKVP